MKKVCVFLLGILLGAIAFSSCTNDYVKSSKEEVSIKLNTMPKTIEEVIHSIDVLFEDKLDGMDLMCINIEYNGLEAIRNHEGVYTVIYSKFVSTTGEKMISLTFEYNSTTNSIVSILSEEGASKALARGSKVLQIEEWDKSIVESLELYAKENEEKIKLDNCPKIIVDITNNKATYYLFTDNNSGADSIKSIGLIGE